jgi:type III secretion system chaperone SycN
MSWIDDTLAEFGEQLGIPSLQLGAQGVLQLELQAGGLLGVQLAEGASGDVLVYLGRPLGFDAGTVLRNALAHAHHASASPMPVQVAVRGEGPEALLIALTRVPEREFTLQALTGIVDYLGRWSDGARHG